MNEAKRWLKQARQHSGLSQRSLAEIAGVPQSTVARIESGAHHPRTDTLVRLLHTCGFELELNPRLEKGVDRDQIRERLALTPQQRLEELTKAAAAIREVRTASPGSAAQPPR